MKIEVVEYSAEWSEESEREKEKICSEVGQTVVVLHHIGSTSVPGLSAKPIIDILLETPSLELLDQVTPELEALALGRV